LTWFSFVPGSAGKSRLASRTRRDGRGSGRLQRLCSVGFLAVLCALAACPVFATNFRTYGFGARAVAMGGAMTGHVDDFTATFYNPAGLVRNRGSDFTIGVQYVDIDVGATNPSPVPEGHVRFSDAFPIDDALGVYGGMRFIIPWPTPWRTASASASRSSRAFRTLWTCGCPFPSSLSTPC